MLRLSKNILAIIVIKTQKALCSLGQTKQTQV